MRTIVLILHKFKTLSEFYQRLDFSKFEKFNLKGDGLYIENQRGFFVDISICGSIGDSFDDEEFEVVGCTKI